MRITPVAFIEFHWLKPTPEPERRVAPKRPSPAHGYRLPGRLWGSPFDGIACFDRHPPIVFFQPIHEMPPDAPQPYVIWHRIH